MCIILAGMKTWLYRYELYAKLPEINQLHIYPTLTDECQNVHVKKINIYTDENGKNKNLFNKGSFIYIQ